MAIFAGFSIHSFAVAQRAASVRDLSWQAAIAASAIDQRLGAAVATLQTIAQCDELQQGLFEPLHAESRRIVAHHQDAAAILLIGRDRRQIFNTDVDFGLPLHPPVRPDTLDTVFEHGQPATTDFFFSPILHQPLVAVNVPVFVNGRVEYVLRMSFYTRALSNLISSNPLPEGWTLVLLDGESTIIGRNRDAEKYIGKTTTPAVLEAIARNDGAPFVSKTYDDIEMEAVVAGMKRWNWRVVLGTPTEALDAPIRHSLIMLGLGGISLCGIGVLLALRLSRHLAREVSGAVAASVALRQGNTPTAGSGSGTSTVTEFAQLEGELEAVKIREDQAAAEQDRLRNSEKLLAVANLELAQQAEQLSRYNAELEQFAYVASHDLREPLRTISSYIALLERRYWGVFDDDAREFLGFTRDGARRLDQMVLDLLEFSRVGRSGPWQQVALEDVVADMKRSLAGAIEESNASVIVEGSLPKVNGIRADLKRLLCNLVGNAIKYRQPDRDPRIVIAASPRDNEWAISVSDNGIGMDPEYFERIFSIFQRLHTQTNYEGAGIGLAICRKVVQSHGGRIWVESEPGQGSTFWFALPTT